MSDVSSAEALERHLGDPLDPSSRISFSSSAEIDRAEAWPSEAYASLSAWGLDSHYVPRASGGCFESHEQLFQLLRVLARRDLTIHRVHGIERIRAAMPLWMAGSAEVRARAAELISNGEVLAAPWMTGGRVRIFEGHADGELDLVMNASRCKAMVIQAAGDVMVLVEVDPSRPQAIVRSPKIRTVGLCGADLTHVALVACPVDRWCSIETSAAEAARSAAGALGLSGPLGAADTALRATLDLALSRRIYGDTIFSIPLARRSIVDAFTALLLADCVALQAVRALDVGTSRPPLTSTARAFVEPIVDDLIRDLSVVMGARYYLREGHWFGAFEKALRDTSMHLLESAPIASTFDLDPDAPERWARASRLEPDLEIKTALLSYLRRVHDLQGTSRLAMVSALDAWTRLVSAGEPSPFQSAAWLVVALERLFESPAQSPISERCRTKMADTLMELYREKRLFSLASFALA